MTNVVPVLQMLGLPLTSGTAEIIEAIRGLQRVADIQKRRGDTMEEAWKEERLRTERAESPDNWRAVWTGDPSTENIETTALSHGNLVTLEGTGQVLMHFRPCCQNLDCKCTSRRNRGYCDCHENDE